MSDTSSPHNIWFPGALTLVFIVLKLTGHIDWSWWWVTSPLWITFILVFVLLAIIELNKHPSRRV